MKIGVRKPSIKKSIKARTTGKLKRKVKSSINPLYGKKGMGLVNNPKKAVYNKVYNKTTIGVNDIVKGSSNKHQTTNSLNNVENNNKIYKIVNNDNVIIGNKEYCQKNIKAFKNTFIFITILFIVSGIVCLPIGIIFILLGLFMYSMFKTYKEIYNEMLNFKDEKTINLCNDENEE